MTGSLDEAMLEALVGDASAAPSAHNAQPWRFRYLRSAHTLQLRADPSRTSEDARTSDGAGPTEPQWRALHIGCGAALLNLRVAAWHAGLRPEVELLPDADEPEVLASVRFEAAREPADHELAGLWDAIGGGRTSRYPHTYRPLAPELRGLLAEQARREGVRLAFPSGWHLSLVLELVEEAEQAAQHHHPGSDGDEYADRTHRTDHAEHPPHQRAREGVHGARRAAEPEGAARYGTALYGTTAAGMPGPGIGSVPEFVRQGADGEQGTGGGPVPGETATGAGHAPVPQLGLVSTGGDRPRDWLLAGQGMERALLCAAGEGLASSFAARAVERADLRWLLRDPVWGVGPVHMVFRLGYGQGPGGPHVPRRPPHDVLEVSP